MDRSSRIQHNGTPVDVGDRPSLLAPELFRPWVRDAVPVDDELFVVSVFEGLGRGGNRSNAAAFTLLDAQGTMHGRLSGFDRDTSPFAGHHYALAVDPARGLIFHCNTFELFVFDRTGRPVHRGMRRRPPAQAAGTPGRHGHVTRR